MFPTIASTELCELVLCPILSYLDDICTTNVVCYHLEEQRYLTLSGTNHKGNAPQLPNLVAITVIAKNMSRTGDITIYTCAPRYHSSMPTNCAEKSEKDELVSNLFGCFSGFAQPAYD